MFHYSEWALKRDEELATKIFTEPTEELNSDKVLNFLSPFKTATVSYLEHIIHGQGSKVSLQYTIVTVMCQNVLSAGYFQLSISHTNLL